MPCLTTEQRTRLGAAATGAMAEHSDMDVAQFLAYFPPIQSAIKVGPDGMRVQLDVPESEMAQAVKMLAWRQCVLKVTVEPESWTELDDETEKGAKGSGPAVGSRRVAIRRDK